MRWRFLSVVALTGLVGCGGSLALTAARSGTIGALKTEIGKAHAAGELSNGEAADIAKALATFEIDNAKPDAVVERMHEVRECARELDGALRRRAENHDYVGSEAALLRLESGKQSPGGPSEYLTDPLDGYRAIAARGLRSESDRAERKRALADASPLVRRQALLAAFDAADPRDAEDLFDMARRDPSPGLRVEAVRVIGQLSPGGRPGMANRLRDLWALGEHPLREAVAAAYARPEIYAAGGKQALEVIVAGSPGPGVIEGARALLADTNLRDAGMLDTATGQLLRAIEQGSIREKHQAIAVAPIADGCAKEATDCDRPGKLARAIEGQLDDDTADHGVKVSALARLLGLSSKRDMALKKLEAFALGDAEEVASRAQYILARAGHLPVQALLEKQLTQGDATRRLLALDALAVLGRAARGAPLLADENVTVRMKAACTILVASRTKG